MEQFIYKIQKRSQADQSASVVVLDAHGDLAESVKKFDLNRDKPSRLVYLDPCLRQGEYTPTINPLDISNSDAQSVEYSAQAISGVFEELFPKNDITNYMKAVLHPCLSTLLRMNGVGLYDLQQFLSKDRSQSYIRA